MSLQEFFHMGGYGFYVWWSYGLAAIALVYNVAAPIMGIKKLRQEIVGIARRESKR